MSAIDNITEFAQDVYFTINGTENDDTGADEEVFQNDFIRAFNLFVDEYETEAYWNKLRVDDYVLDTIANTTDYVFPLPDDYRTPVFNQYKEVKLMNDGSIISRFKLVDPSQRVIDERESYDNSNRAAFVGRNIVLSRPPNALEVGCDVVLDVVKFHPKLARTDDDGISLLPSKQLGVLGVAKNTSLASVVKASLSPSFAQKYNNELSKEVFANNQTNEVYDMQRDNCSNINGIW